MQNLSLEQKVYRLSESSTSAVAPAFLIAELRSSTEVCVALQDSGAGLPSTKTRTGLFQADGPSFQRAEPPRNMGAMVISVSNAMMP